MRDAGQGNPLSDKEISREQTLVAFVAVVANTTLLANVHLFLVTFLGKGINPLFIGVPAFG